MHYYTFHPAKFNHETKMLTRIERAIYRELLDEYTGQERPFVADVDKLAWRLAIKDDAEKQALKIVLDNFFELKTDKKGNQHYHHPRLDREIRTYKWNKKDGTERNAWNETGTQAERSGTDKERKERYKQKRQRMMNALTEKGVTLDKSMGMAKLRTLFNAHCGNDGGTLGTDLEQSGTDGNGTGTPKSDVKQLTSNNKPVTNNQESESNAPTHPTFDHATPSKSNPTGTMANPVLDTTPAETKKSKSNKPAKFDAKTYPIGDSVDLELWCDFVEMRLLIKKPLTENACKQFAKDFENWANDGLSPNLAIAESIKNSWQGIFRDRAIVKIDRPQQQPKQQQRWGGINDPLAVNKKFENYDLEAEAKRMGIKFVDEIKPTQTQGVQLW